MITQLCTFRAAQRFLSPEKANSSWYGAGIGGNKEGSCGIIDISGGNITAIGGGSYSTGIGGGYYGSGGRITITGGTVKATGMEGAGIGGGQYGSGVDVTISGGFVEATSNKGAGIGGGQYGSAGNITISGGYVEATSSKGAGIGSGEGGKCGTFTPNGNAVIFASNTGGGSRSINADGGDPDKSAWKGVIFENYTGKVYGNNIKPAYSFAVPSGYTLEIPKGVTFNISGITLTNNGTIETYCADKNVYPGAVNKLHVYGDLSKNETHHWHECTDSACTDANKGKKDEALHSYDQRVANDTYFKSKANCTTPTTYYKSCVCGKKSTTATFTVGSALGHSFTNQPSNVIAFPADCTNPAKYYVKCDRCAAVSNTITVTVGEKLGHSFGAEWVHNETQHWHKCKCGEKSSLENHTFGKWETVAGNEGLMKRTCTKCNYAETKENPVPAKPVVTVTNGNGKATLKWNPVSGATSYVVYMYNPSTKTYKTVVTTTATTYTKTGLTNGTTYKFAVRAKNASGLSPWTTADVVTAKPTAPVPAKPVVTAINGNRQVTLKWNPVSGATSYVVYMYNPSTRTYQTVVTTTATTYTKTGLTNGSTYKFAVRAKNASGLSPWTTADVVTAKPTAPVPAKPVVTVTNGNGKATLKWNAVSGATSYVVYMYNPSTRTYQTVVTTTATTYTKTGLTNGTTYKFAVRAKNAYGLSPWTTADVVTAKPTAPVPAKPVVTVTNGNGKATLKWNPVSGATSYVVYMYDVSTKTYKTVVTTTATTYTKTGLTNGTTYKFAVRAKNAYGLSPWTTADVVTAKPVATAVPAKPSVRAIAGNGSVTLSWNSVANATRYYIYQYNPSTGTYKLVTTTTATTYTKTGLTNGTTYKFIVRAYNANGLSAYTAADAVSATPKA